MDDGLNIVFIICSAIVATVAAGAFGLADAPVWVFGIVVLAVAFGAARISVMIDNRKDRRDLARWYQTQAAKAAADAALAKRRAS